MKRYVMTKDKTIRLSTPQDELNADIDKISDNLIDLLEVGDMVEIINEDKNTEIYHLTKTTLDNFDYLFEGTTIVALWKRNGDIMRRYEV